MSALGKPIRSKTITAGSGKFELLDDVELVFRGEAVDQVDDAFADDRFEHGDAPGGERPDVVRVYPRVFRRIAVRHGRRRMETRVQDRLGLLGERVDRCLRDRARKGLMIGEDSFDVFVPGRRPNVEPRVVEDRDFRAYRREDGVWVGDIVGREWIELLVSGTLPAVVNRHLSSIEIFEAHARRD